MNFKSSLALLSLTFVIAGCGSSIRHTPQVLSPVAQTANIGQTWQSKSLGSRIVYPMQMSVVQQNLIVAGSDGTIALVSSISGLDIWRFKLTETLSSGVGFNGDIAAVTTEKNELIALQSKATSAALLWRASLSARVYTAPLVAGGRIFVLSGDRAVQAFDAQSGRKLWTLQRTAEPLILSQAGTLGVFGNTLLVGASGRLLGVNPDTGQVQWETSIASNRATNDIERLMDLVGSPNRVGDSVCVRAYQASVACVDALKGVTLWSKPTQGSVGISGDASVVISTESDGRVKAWNRTNGQLQWTNDKLAHRSLSAPLLIGNSIVVGDFEGNVHVLNKIDGTFTARFKTDGSQIIAAPVVAGNIVMVATARGNLFAFSPQ